MLTCCWSVKGGSGTTVVAAGLALAAARAAPVAPVVIVDLCGDLPAALAIAEPDGPGVAEWSRDGLHGALRSQLVPVTPHLQLLHRGRGGLGVLSAASLAAAVPDATVVVDAGVVDDIAAPNAAVATHADRSLLVLRPCFLALRRAVRLGLRPHGIVLVTEPGRALGAHDVSDAVGAPVVAEVPVDPAVSRAVDAGLLAARCPAPLALALEAAR
ncbi:MAG TPA: hypothetical protein VF183_04030 [Acidimicrobiales bacterium]